jgi:hypothetical protein
LDENTKENLSGIDVNFKAALDYTELLTKINLQQEFMNIVIIDDPLSHSDESEISKLDKIFLQVC